MSQKIRRVLLVSYFFPPAAGAGVQRPLKFAKFLPQFDYRVTVLTVAQDHAGRTGESTMDPSLDAPSGEGVDVVRIKPWEPWRLARFLESRGLGTLRDFFAFPDRYWSWALPAYLAAKKLVEQRNVALVFTTSPPHSTQLIGLMLQRRYDTKWIADFRDSWTQESGTPWPSFLHFKTSEVLHKRILTRSDHLIYISPSTPARVREKFPCVSEEKISVIQNGFDPEEMPASGSAPSAGNTFKIVHMGTFYRFPELMEGRRRSIRSLITNLIKYVPLPADFRSHSPFYLLEAVKLMTDRTPCVRNNLRLIFIGRLVEGYWRLAANCGLNDIVEVTGYLPHRRALLKLMEADVLFFPLAEVEGGCYNWWVPGKLYEYLASRKTILAPIPEGDAKEILTQSGLGIFVPPKDVEAMARTLYRLYCEHKQGTLKATPNDEVIQRYDRRDQARRLAELFDKVLQEKG